MALQFDPFGSGLAANNFLGAGSTNGSVFGAGSATPIGNLSGPSDIAVPGLFCHVNGALRPLTAPHPIIPSPLDDGIQASVGDDITAPNAVTAARLNRIVCISSANVGYSEAAQDTKILPSALQYDATIAEGTKANNFSLSLRMTLEFQSAFPSEGMVVWLKKHQQYINGEKLSQLLLVETVFEDYVNGAWVPITADVRYTDEAEAVMQAVITTDSGQTAGRIVTKEFVEDAKLGPVGERGRIVLTYFCDNLYSYAEMDLAGAGIKPPTSRKLVPFGLQLPWASLDNPGNQCHIQTTVRGPTGSVLLDSTSNILAYRDLQKSLTEKSDADLNTGGDCKQMQCAILPAPVDGCVSTWSFSRPSLPPKPMMILTWLSVPDADAGWEHVDMALPKTTCAVLLKPTSEDENLLRVSLPGGQAGHLIRCRVDTEGPTRQPGSVRVHTDITISDASGSTGMRAKVADGTCSTVRQCFNRHEERRLLKRLEAIPKLCQAGILLPQDIWRLKFVIFDHRVKQEFSIESKVEDLDACTVGLLIKAITKADVAASSQLQSSGKQSMLQTWTDAMKSLRGISPGGATSFVEGANRARTAYRRSDIPGAEHTAYINFDTDGGNNCGPCYDAIRELVDKADVVQGHVLGVGSWVDQDCASRIAKLLKGSVHLALDFPDDAAADEHFRQDLSRWIKVLRSAPLSLKCSAGATSWLARQGQRFENAADCLFAEGSALRFDSPDVSDTSHTKSVLRGLMAGESTTFYMLSRLPFSQLATCLELDVAGVRAQVVTGTEPLQGVVLGHHWLSLFGKSAPKAFTTNSPMLCTRLRHRIEDDLSFIWNLPSISGSTAALGRAETQRRPPVAKGKQPSEPTLPLVTPPRTRPMTPPRGRGSIRQVGLFGGSPAPPPAACSLNLFGGAAPSPAACFGGPPSAPFGAPVAAPGGPGGCFGPPPMGGGYFGRGGFGGMAQPASASSSFSFGSRAQPTSAPPSCNFGAAAFKTQSPSSDFASTETIIHEPATPNALLAISGYMRSGPSETPQESFRRGLGAVQQLAKYGPSALPVPVEDPFVEAFLGAAPSSKDIQSSHYGFTCDATHQCPIIGVRFKSTSTKDHDLTVAARRAGSLAGGSGYRPIPSRAEAMRVALVAVLAWWWVLWPDRGDLFLAVAPNLQELSEVALRMAIANLPEYRPTDLL